MAANETPSTRSPIAAAATSAAGTPTLSQLLARILDQLSVSAWLPAGALVFLVLVVANVRAAEGGDLSAAFDAIGSIGLESLILLLVAIVLATVLTQAFQFEAIQLLEGYWPPGRLAAASGDRLCRRQARRLKRLKTSQETLTLEALTAAKPLILRSGVSLSTYETMLRLRSPAGTQASLDDVKAATDVAWLHLAPVRLRRELDALDAEIRLYPSRVGDVLPTRLGNALKAHEERVHEMGFGPLEGFVNAIYHALPASLQLQHDQFRSRLDLYCSFVLLFAVSGSGGAVALVDVNLAEALGMFVLAWTLTWLSYRAAVASARGYGALLVTIAEFQSAMPAEKT